MMSDSDSSSVLVESNSNDVKKSIMAPNLSKIAEEFKITDEERDAIIRYNEIQEE